MANFTILGIHDKSVTTVSGNVARVRVFVKDEEFDFDVPLPEVKSFDQLLKDAIEEKLNQLQKDENDDLIPDETFEKVVKEKKEKKDE